MQLLYNLIAGLYLVRLFQAEVLGKDITDDYDRRFLRHIGEADVGKHIFRYPGNVLLIVFIVIIVTELYHRFFGEGKVGTELPFVVPAFDDPFGGRQCVAFHLRPFRFQ